MAGAPSIVTQTAKFTLASLSVSNSEHASPVLPPDRLVMSQFQVTPTLLGSPDESTPWRVRSFWPGWSFAPFSSFWYWNAAEAGSAAGQRTPSATTANTNRVTKDERRFISGPSLGW